MRKYISFRCSVSTRLASSDSSELALCLLLFEAIVWRMSAARLSATDAANKASFSAQLPPSLRPNMATRELSDALKDHTPPFSEFRNFRTTRALEVLVGDPGDCWAADDSPDNPGITNAWGTSGQRGGFGGTPAKGA